MGPGSAAGRLLPGQLLLPPSARVGVAHLRQPSHQVTRRLVQLTCITWSCFPPGSFLAETCETVTGSWARALQCLGCTATLQLPVPCGPGEYVSCRPEMLTQPSRLFPCSEGLGSQQGLVLRVSFLNPDIVRVILAPITKKPNI